MAESTFRVALVPRVFFGPNAEEELCAALDAVRRDSAQLAILPEIPFNPWSPASRTPDPADAEPLRGPRFEMLSRVAERVGIGVVGGAIVLDEAGRRHNTALIVDQSGALVHRYRKVHLPQEPGFWEQDHYQPGSEPPGRCDAFDLPLGLQICSDVNRPSGSNLLGAMGAQLIVVPRSTERASYGRWKPVFQTNALTSCCYVISVNRPGPELGVGIGGPSVAVDPGGDVMIETEDPAIVELSLNAVASARKRYPGYLIEPAELYERGWREVANYSRDSH